MTQESQDQIVVHGLGGGTLQITKQLLRYHLLIAGDSTVGQNNLLKRIITWHIAKRRSLALLDSTGAMFNYTASVLASAGHTDVKKANFADEERLSLPDLHIGSRNQSILVRLPARDESGSLISHGLVTSMAGSVLKVQWEKFFLIVVHEASSFVSVVSAIGLELMSQYNIGLVVSLSYQELEIVRKFYPNTFAMLSEKRKGGQLRAVVAFPARSTDPPAAVSVAVNATIIPASDWWI